MAYDSLREKLSASLASQTDANLLIDLLEEARDMYLAIAKGEVDGHYAVQKFGRSTNVDNGIETDLWDRANATNDVDVWVAPTEARVHALVSSDSNDTLAGSGAQKVKVYGLQTWDTAETSEVVEMAGATPVNTQNSYVIIHRMRVVQDGGTNINTGVITATAATDGTVTAQINATEGRTEMAIYGIPSTQTAYILDYYASAIKAAATLSVKLTLLVNNTPDTTLTTFSIKHTNGIVTDGSNYLHHDFRPYARLPGPAIIKLEANASANNTDVSGGFDVILVDN